MVSGHPLSAAGLHVGLTSHVNVSVSLLLRTGGDGRPAGKKLFNRAECKRSVKVERNCQLVNDKCCCTTALSA